MRSLFDVFQIAALVAFLLLFLGRTLYLWRVRGVQPFHLGRGKPLPQALLLPSARCSCHL